MRVTDREKEGERGGGEVKEREGERGVEKQGK